MNLTIDDLIFVFPLISLAMTLCWSVFKNSITYIRRISITFVLLWCLSIVTFVILGGFSKFHKILDIYGFHSVIIMSLTLLGSLFFAFKSVKGKQTFTIVFYLLNLLLLLYGLELLKSSGSTWGNFALIQGFAVSITALFLIQLLTHTYELNFVYGILKFTAGVSSLVLTILWGLNRGSGEWIGNNELKSKNFVIFTTIVLLIEGVFLMYRASRERYLKKQQMA